MSDGTIVCSQCGAVNDPSANYCYQCGANLAVQRAAAVQPKPSDQTPPALPLSEPISPESAASPEPESQAPVAPTPTSQAPAATPTDVAPFASATPTEPPPAELPPAASTGAEPGTAAPSPPPAESMAAAPDWPFEVPTHQEEAAPPAGPPPPVAWTGQASGPTPLAENVTSSARYIVLAGIGLLVLSCLWVFLSIGTHLQARFGIFCLAPLGLIFLVVGLFLMIQRGPNRRT